MGWNKNKVACILAQLELSHRFLWSGATQGTMKECKAELDQQLYSGYFSTPEQIFTKKTLCKMKL